MRTTAVILVSVAFSLLTACDKSSEAAGSGSGESFISYPYQIQTSEKDERIDQSIEFFEDRILKNPGDGLDYAALAGAYVAKARITNSNEWFERADWAASKSLERLPFENPGALLVRATVMEARHRFAEAIEIATGVLEQKPGTNAAYSILASSNLGFGKYEEGIAHAQTAMNGKPSLSQSSLVGLAHYSRGRTDEAIRAFEEALSAEPPGDFEGSASARIFLGRTHLNNSRLALAEKYFLEALRILPGAHFALAQMAELRIRQGNWSEAEMYFAKAVESMEEPPYLIRHGRLKSRLGDREGALKLWRQAEDAVRAEMESGPYGHHNELARILIERADPAEAEEALEQAKIEVGVRPVAESFNLLAWAHRNLGDWKAADSAIRSALEIGTKDSEILLNAAEIARSLGDTERAKVYLEMVLVNDPTYRF